MNNQDDRRRSRRLLAQELFSIFLVISGAGPRKINIRDMSRHGIAFEVDGELLYGIDLKQGSLLNVGIYLSPTVYIPARLEIVRSEQTDTGHVVGSDFIEWEDRSFNAFEKLLDFLDAMSNLEPENETK